MQVAESGGFSAAGRRLNLSMRAGDPVVARISGRLISSHYETTLATAVVGIGLILTSLFVVADQIAWGALVLLLPD